MNKTVSISEFAANSGAILDAVMADGQSIVVTRDGLPVATMAPIVRHSIGLLGCMKGTITITDQRDGLLSALDDAERSAWESSLDAKAARMSAPLVDTGRK